jgi:hypothetical protein
MDAMHIFIGVMAVIIAILALLNPLHRDFDDRDITRRPAFPKVGSAAPHGDEQGPVRGA